jgi:hypothetical protein
MIPEDAVERLRLIPVLFAWVGETQAVLEFPTLEQGWVGQAAQLLQKTPAGTERALETARSLPELPTLRMEWVNGRQQAWVDALERLQRIIVHEGGSRSPLAETLFARKRMTPLRRARPEAVRDFVSDFNRRRRSGYVQRQLDSEGHASLRDPLAELDARFQEWEQALAQPPLQGVAAEEARAALVAVGQAAEVRLCQARLLLEAALLASPEGVKRLREAPRPKRRTSRSG